MAGDTTYTQAQLDKAVKEAKAGLLTQEKADKLIAAATKDLYTEDQVDELRNAHASEIAKLQAGAVADVSDTCMTNAEAASLVHRVAKKIGEDGKPTGETRKVAVPPGDVLSFREYPDHVMVVTTNGEKLRGDK